MKSLTEIAKEYSSKTGDLTRGTDKGTVHSYIPVYEEILAPYRDKDIRMLEVGVAGGWSLVMWSEYFANAELHGMDIINKPERLNAYPDIRFHKQYSDNHTVLDKLGDLTFDIIIDDGCHEFNAQMRTAMLLFQRLRPGGLYIVEDMKKPEASVYFRALGPATHRGKQARGSNDRLVVIRKEG